ncbi:MAG: MBL fold metallo-hydrolase [Phycisphaerae bacterium]
MSRSIGLFQEQSSVIVNRKAPRSGIAMGRLRGLIRDFQPPRGMVALWWLGQSGFVIKLAGKIIYLDVFFTPVPIRVVPPLLTAVQVDHADIICGTHDHLDHIDRPSWPALAKASPAAIFVVPELVRRSLIRDLGIPAGRLVGVDEKEPARIGPITIFAMPASHEFLDRDPKTGLHPFLGYVIQADGWTIYHAGDTCVYEGIHDKLRRFKPDVMLLPINGRDGRRLKSGCIGNMTFQEAVDLAGNIAPGLVAPIHYDMFKFNAQDPKHFMEYLRVKYPAQHGIIFKRGKLTLLKKSRGNGVEVKVP